MSSVGYKSYLSVNNPTFALIYIIFCIQSLTCIKHYLSISINVQVSTRSKACFDVKWGHNKPLQNKASRGTKICVQCIPEVPAFSYFGVFAVQSTELVLRFALLYAVVQVTVPVDVDGKHCSLQQSRTLTASRDNMQHASSMLTDNILLYSTATPFS